MDNLILANQISLFNLFGWGFLVGCLFGFVMMLVFEFFTHLRKPHNS